MHQNFYHWHSQAELKPESTVLEPRWKAASKFAETISATEICSLLRMVLFLSTERDFAKRLADAVMKAEPTFPPDGNAVLLRVMATAAAYDLMTEACPEANAVALGLRAASFSLVKIKPVCPEIMDRADEYLAGESERVRPAPNLNSAFKDLTAAVEKDDWESDDNASKLLGGAVIELGQTMGRISEENQFLWWLLGRWSSILTARRAGLTSKGYALVAAAEAAARVTTLPPPASVEPLIEEVLTQCNTNSNSPVTLKQLFSAPELSKLCAPERDLNTLNLTPIMGVLAIRRAGSRIDEHSVRPFAIDLKERCSPVDASRQYFRELMFLRALKQID